MPPGATDRPRFEDHDRHLRAMIDAALRAADPHRCVAEGGRASPPPPGPFAVLAVGKAAGGMVRGFLEARPDGAGSVVIAPEGVPLVRGALVGDHPLPSERNTRHAARARDWVRTLASGTGCDGLVVLLSGGASVLLTLPADGLGLDEYRRFTDALLRSGRLTIRDINRIRKHCEQLKGGRFAAMLGRLWCRVYVLSDVLGDPVDAIGSGPFAPDPTTFDDALRALDEAYPDASDRWPGIAEHLRSGRAGRIPDTPKPGDAIFDRVRHFIVGNNETAARAAVTEAARLGYRTTDPELLVQGDAGEIGRRFAARAATLGSKERPTCLILGGETTVNVGGSTGRGGRNQELALAAAIEIDGVPNVSIAAFATDGVDGPTDAAGAIVTGETCARARGQGVDPSDFIVRHDSYTFFQRVGGHLKTGPTGTNVNDLAIALAF